MKTKDIVTAAMFSAIITMLMFLDARFSYTLSQYFGFILPVFIATLVLQENRKVAYLTCISSFFLSLITGTTLITFFYVIPAFFLGIITGNLLKSKYTANKIFYMLSITNMFFTIIQYYSFAMLLKLPSDPIAELTEFMQSLQLNFSYSYLLLIVISMLLAISILQVLVILILLRYIALRFHYQWNIISLSEFRSNKIMAFFAIVYFFVACNLDHFKMNQFLSTINIIAIAVFLVIHFIVGESIVLYTLRYFNKGKWISILPIISCIPFVMSALILLGILDGFIDVRKKIKEI